MPEVITYDGSFSGTDIKVYAVVNSSFSSTDDNIGLGKTSPYKELAELQTISYSIYRDKLGVKVLGKSNPTGFTRGYVTIAGTMIFTVLHERVLHEILGYSITGDSPSDTINLQNVRIDQLPPLDIFITFENEYGSRSRLAIYGVEFINEGQVMSVADLITENSVNYVAKHISPMRKVSELAIEPYDNSSTGFSMTESEYDLAKQQIKNIRSRWM